MFSIKLYVKHHVQLVCTTSAGSLGGGPAIFFKKCSSGSFTGGCETFVPLELESTGQGERARELRCNSQRSVARREKSDRGRPGADGNHLWQVEPESPNRTKIRTIAAPPLQPTCSLLRTVANHGVEFLFPRIASRFACGLILVAYG